MAGEVFIWFVGLQRTGHFVTGPSEKSACVLRGRGVMLKCDVLRNVELTTRTQLHVSAATTTKSS